MTPPSSCFFMDPSLSLAHSVNSPRFPEHALCPCGSSVTVRTWSRTLARSACLALCLSSKESWQDCQPSVEQRSVEHSCSYQVEYSSSQVGESIPPHGKWIILVHSSTRWSCKTSQWTRRTSQQTWCTSAPCWCCTAPRRRCPSCTLFSTACWGCDGSSVGSHSYPGQGRARHRSDKMDQGNLHS